MRNSLRLLVSVLLFSSFLPAQNPAETKPQQSPTQAVVLQKDEGETRTRRPREVAMASREFMLKVSPKNNGSKHLVLGTEEILPGGMIPKHKHHGQDEILLIQTGTAHVWLGDKEYDALPGSMVFIPSETWISLKNTGKENISLTYIFNEPGYEDTMRCSSVPKGQPTPPISKDELRACQHKGHAEFEALETVPSK
jgi:mannose-6-phosphate isomerase-like protein (cupin superfamily)